jgi:hypothetical protein
MNNIFGICHFAGDGKTFGKHHDFHESFESDMKKKNDYLDLSYFFWNSFATHKLTNQTHFVNKMEQCQQMIVDPGMFLVT